MQTPARTTDSASNKSPLESKDTLLDGALILLFAFYGSFCFSGYILKDAVVRYSTACQGVAQGHQHGLSCIAMFGYCVLAHGLVAFVWSRLLRGLFRSADRAVDEFQSFLGRVKKTMKKERARIKALEEVRALGLGLVHRRERHPPHGGGRQLHRFCGTSFFTTSFLSPLSLANFSGG